MTDKYIYYEHEGKNYRVPEDQQKEFESRVPSARIMLTYNNKNYGVPISEYNAVVQRLGSDKLTYSVFDDNHEYLPDLSTERIPSFEGGTGMEPVDAGVVDADDASLSRRERRQARREERRNDGETTWWETITNAVGSMGVRTGQLALDLMRTSWNTGAVGGALNFITGKTLEEKVSDENNLITRWTTSLGETADRLSMSADPTAGQKGYVDLIMEGDIKHLAQKALASGIESLPMMVAAGTGWGALLYGAAMASSQYAEETRENPDIPAWKRASNAIGSAAMEMAVEKLGGPLNDIFKGGKGITEEIAKEILEEAVKEGTEGVAKRIIRVLGKIGKQGAEEGWEEVITSFGNDAIGEALDIIDGNEDYGIRAQWQRLLEENPDASLADFAWAKGREYMDAFIGGAVSGMQISGATTAVNEGVRAMSNPKRDLELAYQAGQDLSYEDLYDVDSTVADAYTAVSDAFAADGESTLSQEFISGLTADEAYALSQREDFSRAQRAAFGQLALAKSQQDGLSSALDERLESSISKNIAIIQKASVNGKITTGSVHGKSFYVKGGIVKNGSVFTTEAGTHGPIIVIDPSTGDELVINSSEITSALTSDSSTMMSQFEMNARNYESQNRENSRNTMSVKAKTKASMAFVGKKIMVDLGNGIIEVEVQNVMPQSGEILVKGKKGDLGGQGIVKLPVAQFYDSIYRDENGEPVITETGSTPSDTPADEGAIPDYRGETLSILQDGEIVEAEVISQDDAANRIVYKIINKDGSVRTISSTIEEFGKAVGAASNPTPAAPVSTPEAPVEPEVPSPVDVEPEVPAAPIEPEAIDWDTLFESDPEAYFAELKNQFGDDVLDILNEEIEAAQNELDALAKAKTKSQNERLENRKKKQALQNRIDALNGMVARLAPPAAPASPEVAPEDPTAPVGPTVPQGVENVPDFSTDKASEARKRGFRMTNGQRVDRRGETSGVYGKDIEVTFTSESKGKRAGKVKVIEAGSLVPSHIGGVENVYHFLPEAQPKKRTDAASTVSATLIAQNMDSAKMTNVSSSAYEGAPSVNKRGEAIQGNNRAAAIIEMYQAYPEKAAEYKQYLIDHSAEFGIDAATVAAMQNPVLVRELDVDDTDAIALGQHTMQDMESGGSQMIDSGRAIAGLSNKGLLEEFIARLLAEENEESSDMNLNDLITRNGNDAIKILYHNGIINQTQYQSALGPNGKVTADARAALRGIIEQQLFANGIDNLSVMFEVLPDKAKKAIMQTIARDLKNPEDSKVTPYIQEAIEIYYQLNKLPDFVSAKTDAEIDSAIESFKAQTSLDQDGVPAEKYTNFAFVLARNFKAKTQKQQRELLNYLYDTIEGTADIFGESEGKSLGEAVAEVYNTNLNKAKDETDEEGGTPVLEGGTGEGPEGRQGSTGGVGVRPTTGEGGQGAGNGGTNTTFGGGVGSEGEVSPKAPKPVDNPVAEAQKKEKSLAIQLKRIGIPHEQKQDMAFNAGKAVADFFATREEYEAYAENATDFGEYNADFEKGVDASFANRPQNTGGTPGNSVPLENEPKGEDNGGKEDAPEGGDTNGPAAGTDGGGTDNGGSKEGDSGDKGKVPPQGPSGSESGKESGKVKHQYPARKGNVTGKILIDTFGLAAVDIPNSRKDILNTFYDFMMEMSKILGISPKSIGNGGWLTLGNLRANARAFARHAILYKTFGGDIVEQHLLLKYSRVSSIAHEWWHSLDHALAFFEKGKNKGPATEIATGAFDGRQETLEAVRAIMQAIRDSGYTSRIQSHPQYTRDFKNYVLEPTESAARAFAEFIRNKFDEQGIAITGVNEFYDDTQPTAEEMKIIAPAIENLFKVLQEKEGKNTGTSILYQIGEDVDRKVASSSETSEVARKLANEAIDMMFEQAGREVVFVTDEQAEQMRILAGADAEFMIDSYKPVFVSNAAVAVMGIKQEKATPAQWLAMIEKAGGLKAGEDKWMGLSDWLKASDKKTLTKQEVLDYIADNTIRIEEQHYLEDAEIEAEELKQIDAIKDEFFAFRSEAEASGEYINDAGDIAYQQMVEKYGDDFAIGFGVDMGKLYVSNLDAAASITGIQPRSERYINETRAAYTTDGLTNKREIALTVPTIESWGEQDEVHFGDAGEGRAVAWVRFGETTDNKELSNDEREAIIKSMPKPEMWTKHDGSQFVVKRDIYVLDEASRSKYGFIVDRGGKFVISGPIGKRMMTIQFDTFDEAVYAFYRAIVPKVKKSKILVIDEIQSKRHQEGREKGYKPDWRGMKRLRKAFDEAKENFAAVDARMIQKYGGADYIVSQTDLEEYQAAKKAVQDAYYELSNPRFNSIPDAPFDKNWHELAMKRMLRYAAENGYDAIAWTKGEQQAERYDIGGVISDIKATKYPRGYEVVSFGNNGNVVHNEVFADENAMAEVYGIEMSQKIIESVDALEPSETATISGDDLKIGGEGMKGFYDKMLPAFMNKYGKKWGIKVADITLPNVEEAGRVMHSVPVTDAMKESVMEGQVMFMKRPNGKVFGWTDGKKIYLTKDGLNPNTKIHEYTHLWAQAMMQKNPKGWQSVKDLLRGTPVWNEVLNDPNYSNIHADEDLVASEVLSRISGREGSAKLERMAQQMVDEAKGSMRKLEARGLVQRIKDALNEFWNWVGTELFGIEKFESVEQVTDRVLWDLINATDLGSLEEGQTEFSIIPEGELKEKLKKEIEDGEYITLYRAVRKINGKYYSPKMSKLGGVGQEIVMGELEQSDERPDLAYPVTMADGTVKYKVNLDGSDPAGTGLKSRTTNKVDYNPYIHASDSMMNDQFTAAFAMPEMTVIEVRVPKSELTSGYHAEKAADHVGLTPWKSGTVDLKLPKDEQRNVYLSRYDMPVREVPTEEIADHIAAKLLRNGLSMPYNLVTPQVAEALIRRGVDVSEKPSGNVPAGQNEKFKELKERVLNDMKDNDSPITPEMDADYRKAEAQNAAVDYLAGEPRLRTIENAVNEEASKLGVKVTYKTREQMPNGHQNDKGYYDPKTGEMVVCTENATSIADAIQTILHEAVAHMGLRQLMGDKFNEFINRVYDSLDAETKAKVDALAESQYNGNKAVAMEEYMATLAESTDFKKGTLWDKIKSIFEDIINAILGRNDIKIGDNELRYILRASYNNMVNPRGMNTMRGWARDLMMREEYGIGMTSDEIAKLDAEYMKAVEEGDMETAQRLVLEAAKRAMPNTKVVDKNGAPKVVYHGSPNVFYKFGSDSSVKRAHTAEDTHFFVDDMEVAQSYGKELYPVFLNLANPIVKDFDGNAWNQYAGPITPEELKEWEEERKARKERIKDLQEKIEMLKTDYEASIDENDIFGIGDPVILQEIHELESELNMATLLDRALSTPPTHTYSTTDKLVAGSRNTSDGAIFKNVTDAASPELIHKVVTDYVAYDPSQIKSAAPVTYDDNGNVIPLSLRFNLSNDDIRYRTGINPEEVSAMSAKEVYESVVDKQWQEFQREMQDAYQPVRIAIDAIQQETGNIPIEDYENYLLVQNHSSSRSRAEIDEFERKYYAPIIVQVKTMIDSIMKARKLRLNDKKKRAEVYSEIRQYLIAKHGLERNHYYQAKTGEMKDYSGLTSLFGFDPDNFQDAEAEAERCIKSFETMFGRVDGYDSAGNPVVNQGKEINRLWDKINAATDKTLRHSYESGMISRQQYDDIRSMFEFYIPLRGFDEQTAEDVYDYARFEGNRFSPAVMKAKGRKSVANDPLAYILNMAESEIMQGNRNKAKQALYHFVFNRTVVLGKEDGLMQIESVWYYKNVDADGNVTYVMAAPDKAAGETYEQFEERMKKLEESGDAVRKKGKVDIGMRFQKPADLDSHYVFLNINGEEKAVYINGNPKAADAVNGRFFKTKSEFVEKYGKVNRFLSSVFTNYSIEFTFRNLIRDAIYSRINISQKESPAYRLKFRKNWWKHNFIAMAFLASRYRNGKLEKANLNETERAFVEFMKNGGETGYVIMNKVENQKAALEKEMTRLRNGLSNGGVKNSSALNLLFGWIELINQASELATRFAAFKTSRDMGRSTLLSVRDAKEITVNFNTKGAQDGKGWAGVIASYFGWSKYFFNASVQGVQNVKAMADANKLKFCGTVGSIIAAGFFMPVITSIISQLFGGDDDEEYWNIPEYDRHNNLCIVIGDKRYIKIPLPVGFREMFAIGDMVSAMHFDKKFSRDIATVGKDIANKIASIVLPINPLEGTANGLSFWQTFAYTTLPSSFQVVIQNMTNTDWRGAPLQKEYTYNENDPKWMKAFNSNPDWMKGLSKWCNENINIDGDFKGWDWSPEKLDNTLSNLLGGIYTLIKDTGNTISMAWNEDKKSIANVPVAGTLVGSGLDSDERFMTDAYYDMLDYYNSQVGYIKRTAEKFGYDLDDVFKSKKGAHHPKMSEIYGHDDFTFMSEWYKRDKKLKDKYDKVKEQRNKIASKKNPSQLDYNRLERLTNKYLEEQRDMVNFMLELD